MLIRSSKILPYIFLSVLLGISFFYNSYISYSQPATTTPAKPVSQPVSQPASQPAVPPTGSSAPQSSKKSSTFELFIDTKDQICRSSSPITVNVYFKNISNQPEKLCIYKLNESLLRLDLRKAGGNKFQFDPVLIKARPITPKDWLLIKPGGGYKTVISLSRMYIEKTGSRIKPGNYILKLHYDGCYKFDARIPETSFDSNLLYLMVID